MFKKDPAFLFYSKDWIEGTMELSPAEKGVFIDLLAHQHQKGSLPAETSRLAKLAGLPEQDFIVIWEILKPKFNQTETNRLVNQKLTIVVNEREAMSRKNKVLGVFAAVIKKSEQPIEIKNLAKRGFKVDDFLLIPTEDLTRMVTLWFNHRLTKCLEDGIGNADAINKDRKEGTEGKEEKKLLCPEMVKMFINQYPQYPANTESDYAACLEIAYKIVKANGWPKESAYNGRMNDVLIRWGEIVEFSKTDQWFSTRSISDFNKEYQRLIQKITNGNKHNQTTKATQSSRPVIDTERTSSGNFR